MGNISDYHQRVFNGLQSKKSEAYRMRLTAAQCAELFLESTTTHVQDTVKKTWTPVSSHPPHAHAHIHKEGFTGTGKGRTAPSDFETEGLHIDPSTRSKMSPGQRIVDPMKGKKVPAPYTTRTRHSQFEDSEVAIMGLFFALNTKAGLDALAYLKGAKGTPRRAVITSHSAANGLKNLEQATQRKKGSHSVPQVLERGLGGAGSATLTRAAIAATVTVLDCKNDVLTVSTHYPTATSKKTLDHVEKSQSFVKQTPASFPVRTPLGHDLTWGPEMACVKCGKAYSKGYKLGIFWRWHVCRECGYYYCANCGDKLPGKKLTSRERDCDRKECGGRTRLIV